MYASLIALGMLFKRTTEDVSNNAESGLRLKLGSRGRQCSQIMVLVLKSLLLSVSRADGPVADLLYRFSALVVQSKVLCQWFDIDFLCRLSVSVRVAVVNNGSVS